MTDRQELFRVMDPDTDRKFVIYDNGEIEGFGECSLVMNRFPALKRKAVAEALERAGAVPSATVGQCVRAAGEKPADEVEAMKERVLYEVRCLRPFFDGRPGRDVPFGALADGLKALDEAERRRLPSVRLRAEYFVDNHALHPRQNGLLAMIEALGTDRSDILEKVRALAEQVATRVGPDQMVRVSFLEDLLAPKGPAT